MAKNFSNLMQTIILLIEKLNELKVDNMKKIATRYTSIILLKISDKDKIIKAAGKTDTFHTEEQG